MALFGPYADRQGAPGMQGMDCRVKTNKGRPKLMSISTLKCIFCAITLLSSLPFTAAAQTSITPTEARAIAKEAYVYGFPMVDSYRIQYGYFVDRQDREFKAPWNQIRSVPRVYTPADTAIQTPNSDTPYSFLGMEIGRAHV